MTAIGLSVAAARMLEAFRAPSQQTPMDSLLIAADTALRTLSGGSHAARACPRSPTEPPALSDEERALAGALMRVNHVGEICAQALYSAQSLATRDEALRRQFDRAAREETDHLAWTQQRLDELGSRPSLLNPLWYGGAFAIGLLAGRAGDAMSLGFLVETERQVERHLEGHLQRLPARDTASRVIVDQMRDDEARHADDAAAAGAVPLPAPVRWAMQAAARLMTATAHRI